MPLTDYDQNSIAILATAKTGNLWIKHVLVSAFEMESTEFFESQAIIRHYADAGANRRIVFHAHLPYTAALADVLRASQVRTISLVRNPLDIFLSLRSHVKRLGADSPEQERILSNDPAVLQDFAQTYFLGDLAISAVWARHDAILVRYEDMLSDPLNGFTDLGRKLGVSEADIDEFASFCTRTSDIHDIREHALPGDRAHFTSAEIDKWKRPENAEIASILLDCPPIRTALRLWGYSTEPALAQIPAE